MAPLTTQQMVDKYMQAEADLLDGKIVRWGDREVRREDLPEIRKGRQEWQAKLAQEQRQAAGAPRDNFSLANFRGRE